MLVCVCSRLKGASFDMQPLSNRFISALQSVGGCNLNPTNCVGVVYLERRPGTAQPFRWLTSSNDSQLRAAEAATGNSSIHPVSGSKVLARFEFEPSRGA